MTPQPRKKQHLGLPRNWRHKHGAYYYRVPKAERDRWEGKTEFRLGKTLGEAYIEYGKRQAPSGNVDTMARLCDRYATDVLPHKREATQRSNRYSLQRIRKAFGDNQAADITPQHIYQYRDHVARAKSKKHANLDLEVLSHIFSKSIEWGARSDHPMTGRKVTKFSIKGRTRYVTDQELVAFAQTLPAKWQLMVSLAVWTGRRKAELLNLTRADVREDGLAFKNVKPPYDPFVIAWTDELRAIVQGITQHRERTSSLHLFHTRDGQPYIKPDGTTSGFDSIWQRYMKAWAAAGHERFTLHDLRAKRASDLTADQAQVLLRHTNAKMTARYRRNGDIVRI